MFWYWFFVGPALLLAVLSVRNAPGRARYIRSRLKETPAAFPPATVIVPVKGEDYGLRENLEALASLDYPDFELMVVARCAADIPAAIAAASPPLDPPGDRSRSHGFRVRPCSRLSVS